MFTTKRAKKIIDSKKLPVSTRNEKKLFISKKEENLEEIAYFKRISLSTGDLADKSEEKRQVW